jgi:urease accessory protein
MSNPYASIPPDELHLLYILLDSNLPTGGFVSSSGLESYVKHGFLGLPSFSLSPHDDNDKKEFTAVKGVKNVIRGVTDFAEAEVGQYAQTTGCFVKDSWRVVNTFLSRPDLDEGEKVREVIGQIEKLDEYHEGTLLSHVARRASKAQGIAMLTLYGRGLSRPVGFELERDDSNGNGPEHPGEGDEDRQEEERLQMREKKAKKVIDAYKLLVRKGSVPGHLAVCWGVITAALGLALGMSFFSLPPFSFPFFSKRFTGQELNDRPINPPVLIPPCPIFIINSSPNEHHRSVRIIPDAHLSIQRYHRTRDRLTGQ